MLPHNVGAMPPLGTIPRDRQLFGFDLDLVSGDELYAPGPLGRALATTLRGIVR
jgi:hypothetical protein